MFFREAILHASPKFVLLSGKRRQIRVLDYLQFKVLALRFDLLTQIALRRTFSQDVLGHLVTRRTCKNPLSWICFSLTEFRLLCSAQAGSICSLPGLASLRSLHPSANPLSWICFSLTEFRLLCSAQAGSICSLPGLASLRSLRPSANPQKKRLNQS